MVPVRHRGENSLFLITAFWTFGGCREQICFSTVTAPRVTKSENLAILFAGGCDGDSDTGVDVWYGPGPRAP